MRTDKYDEIRNKEGSASKGQKKLRDERKSRRSALKGLLVFILALLVLIAAAALYSQRLYRHTVESLNVAFTEDGFELNAGEKREAMDYVSDYYGDIIASREYLDTDTYGDKTIVYTVSEPLFGGLVTPEKSFTLHYSVVDKEPPVVLWGGSGTVLELGTEFDINDVISYGDNADPEPSVEVEGKVDMESEGEYPLHVKVTDAAGSSKEWDLYVEVAKIAPVYTSGTSEGTPFEEFKDTYKTKGEAFGIDVSSWQGDIDFEAVRDAGCEFVFIRIGYSIDGEVTIDNCFEQNYKRAKAAGLKIGIYLYSYDNNEKDVRASADWIIERLGGDSLDLPVVFDWEDFGNFQEYKMSFNELNSLYDHFSDELGKAGYECMLYGSKTYLENIWTDTGTRPVWLAHYTYESSYAGPRRFWQASCTGRINGIEGDVDMNIMY